MTITQKQDSADRLRIHKNNLRRIGRVQKTTSIIFWYIINKDNIPTRYEYYKMRREGCDGLSERYVEAYNEIITNKKFK